MLQIEMLQCPARWHTVHMARSKTGGGVGTNQYGVRGVSTRAAGNRPVPPVDLVTQAAQPAAPAVPLRVKLEERPHTERRSGRVYMTMGGHGLPQPPTGPMCTQPACTCAGQAVDHRVWKAWRRETVQHYRAALQAAGIDPSRLRWSDKAGCSCGCSPGFVPTGGSYRTTDAWVTALEGDPAPEDAQIVRALQVDPADLERWARSTSNPTLRQAIADNPNCPDHLRYLIRASS